MSPSPTPVISVFWVPLHSAKSGFGPTPFREFWGPGPASLPASQGGSAGSAPVVVLWVSAVVVHTTQWSGLLVRAALAVMHGGSASWCTVVVHSYIQSIGLLVARRHDYFSSPTEESEFQMVRVCGGR